MNLLNPLFFGWWFILGLDMLKSYGIMFHTVIVIDRLKFRPYMSCLYFVFKRFGSEKENFRVTFFIDWNVFKILAQILQIQNNLCFLHFHHSRNVKLCKGLVLVTQPWKLYMHGNLTICCYDQWFGSWWIMHCYFTAKTRFEPPKSKLRSLVETKI